MRAERDERRLQLHRHEGSDAKGLGRVRIAAGEDDHTSRRPAEDPAEVLLMRKGRVGIAVRLKTGRCPAAASAKELGRVACWANPTASSPQRSCCSNSVSSPT